MYRPATLPRALASTLTVAVLLLVAPVAANAAGFAEAAGRGTLSAFAFAFTAGLLTALTPCVYPMIPITISIFGGRGRVSRAHSLLLATLYVAGIAVMFGALGTTFALLGKAFGTFLGNPWVVVPLALFFFAMAASMFGAFELALPASLQQRLSQVGGRGFAGAFLMGLVGGLIAAPCTGPPLAGILAYVATTRDALRGFLLLATYATGIGVPFWAIAGFSLHLPKSGTWMEGVKAIFGIALSVAGLYYLKPVLPWLATLTSRSSLFPILIGLGVLLGVALGAVHLSFHGGARTKVRKALGLGLVVASLFALTNYVLTPKRTLQWLHSETEAMAQTRSTGKLMLVDFTADWCLPCKEFDVAVFSRPEVAAALDGVVLAKVDVTREDEDDALSALKAKYDVTTLPALRFVTAAGQVVGRIDNLLSWQDFLRAVTDAQAAAEAGHAPPL